MSMRRKIGSHQATCATCWAAQVLLLTRLLFSNKTVKAAAAAAAAAAFRPPSICDELGCSPTLSTILGRSSSDDKRGGRGAEMFFFDPLRIANDDNFPRLRESELKCGRICMLAVAETVLVPLLRRTTTTTSSTTSSILLLDHNGSLLQHAKVCDRLAHLTFADALKVLGACGILETVVLVQRSPRDLPGDYGTGWFGLRDPGRHETLLVSELEHGRLAMLALVAQIGLERWLDRAWDEYWIDAVKEWLDAS